MLRVKHLTMSVFYSGLKAYTNSTVGLVYRKLSGQKMYSIYFYMDKWIFLYISIWMCAKEWTRKLSEGQLWRWLQSDRAGKHLHQGQE